MSWNLSKPPTKKRLNLYVMEDLDSKQIGKADWNFKMQTSWTNLHVGHSRLLWKYTNLKMNMPPT